jgi:hypothetical protein
MSWVWRQGPKDPHQRYVLLKLADYANQDGRCWPSLGAIAIETCLSESSVRRAVKDLEKGGWLEVNRGLGRSNSSQYVLVEKVSGGQVLEEKVSAGKVSVGRIKGVTQTQKGVRETNPPHPLFREPSITTKEPPTEPAPIAFSLPEWVPLAAWIGFTEMRKKMRVPLTDRAKNGIVAELGRLRSIGNDPGVVLDQSTMRGWRGVFPVKGENYGQQRTGKGHSIVEAAESAIRDLAGEAVGNLGDGATGQRGFGDVEILRPKPLGFPAAGSAQRDRPALPHETPSRRNSLS